MTFTPSPAGNWKKGRKSSAREEERVSSGKILNVDLPPEGGAETGGGVTTGSLVSTFGDGSVSSGAATTG
jgi:hypothetical protein